MIVNSQIYLRLLTTSAWDSIQRALTGTDEGRICLGTPTGATIAPFEAGEHLQNTVKVIDN